MQQQMTMDMKQWLALIVLSVLWGASFFFMKVALVELPTFTIVLIRVAIAALALFLYLRFKGVAIPLDGRTWLLFFAVGLFNNLLPFSLLVWGMNEIASGLAAIINATTPLFTILVAHFATDDEKIDGKKLLGIALGMLGVAVLIGLDTLQTGGPLWAIIACLAAALSYAIASMFGRQFKKRGIAPSLGAFGQVTASSILLLPLVFIFESPLSLTLPSTTVLLSLLALGLFSTAWAYVLFFNLLRTAGATNTTLVTLLVPVSAVLLGWVLLSEVLSVQHYMGMLLIGCALLVIDGRLFKRKAKH